MVSSSIWDSMGTLESWAEDGSFLSLSLGWCLVLEAGRPVGQQWLLFVIGHGSVLALPPAQPRTVHFLLFHFVKHYTSFRV